MVANPCVPYYNAAVWCFSTKGWLVVTRGWRTAGGVPIPKRAFVICKYTTRCRVCGTNQHQRIRCGSHIYTQRPAKRGPLAQNAICAVTHKTSCLRMLHFASKSVPSFDRRWHIPSSTPPRPRRPTQPNELQNTHHEGLDVDL